MIERWVRFVDKMSYTSAARAVFGQRKGMFFGQPSDYLFGRIEYKTASGAVKVRAGGMFEMDGTGSSLILMPELEFPVADSVIIQAGAFKVLSGYPDTTKFGSFKKDGMV